MLDGTQVPWLPWPCLQQRTQGPFIPLRAKFVGVAQLLLIELHLQRLGAPGSP